MRPVLFHEQAKAELTETAVWYERQKPGLAREFRSAVEDAVLRIQENPHAGSSYGATSFRFLLVRRFPYVVFYAVGEHIIRVLAVAHGSRRPGYWIRRGNPNAEG